MTEAPLNHPDDESLRALSVGQLTEVELAPVSAHLGDCPACCRRIDQLATDDRLLTRLQQCAAHQEEVLVSPAQRRAAVRALRQSQEARSATRIQRPEAGPASEIANASAFQTHRDGPSLDLSKELTRFLAPPERPDEIGRIGSYRILAVLGKGGMGVVFRAHDPALDRVVALKAMLPGLAAVPTARERFLREARAAAALKHPHIVTIFQVGEDRGAPFLAMEYLEGEPLDQRLRREGRLPVAEVLRIGRETALALAAAHARGLVHRDIKPANLWLEGPTGHVKVLDFGLARATADHAHLTESGLIVGTPAYMAPEQAEGRPVAPRCDLFSLGCILYQMSTATVPFPGSSTIAVLRALALHEPPPVAAARPEAPLELSALVTRLLAKNPEDRPASAQEVAETLRTLEQLPTRQVLPKPGATPARTRRKRVLTLIGAALAALALILIFWLTSNGAVRIWSDDPAGEVASNKEPAPPLATAPFNAQQARDYQQAWAKFLDVPVEITNKLGMKFRLIPPGEFTMGATDAEAEAWTKFGPYTGHGRMAAPAHPVRLTRPFYLAEREVRYRDFLDLMKREPGDQPKHPQDGPDGALVANCTWFDCIEFCNRLSERDGLTPAYQVAGEAVTVTSGATGYRLPTEAEWEFACRAGTTSLWYFGLTAPEAQAMYAKNPLEAEAFLRGRTTAPNPFGLFGMYAGSSEWCWDWFDPGYYRECADRGVTVDPRGPDSGEKRITRGGTNYANDRGDMTLINSAARNPQDPRRTQGLNGFGRVVLPIPAKIR